MRARTAARVLLMLSRLAHGFQRVNESSTKRNIDGGGIHLSARQPLEERLAATCPKAKHAVSR